MPERAGRVTVRVLVDARPAAFAFRTGVGTYVWNLLRRLPVVDPGTEYLAWYLHLRSILDRRRRFEGMDVIERRVAFPSRLYERTVRYGFPPVELFARCDVVFGTNFVPPASLRKPIVVTVHDLAFRLFPETAPQAVAWWRSAVEHAVARAARVIVPSESTRGDLVRLTNVDPDRVVVVPLGVDRSVFSPATPERIDEVRRRFGVDGPYLVSLGRHQRKNLRGLLRAFAAIGDDVRPDLVVTGSAPWTPDGSDHDAPALARLPDRVRRQVSLTGYVTPQEAAALLSGSIGLVFPTLYEGFGFPALEAMACGAPVLTSNTSSLPELVGDAAVLVDPHDEGSIADGLASLVTDTALRERLRAAGLRRAARYDWDETARATAAAQHAAVARP
jgi:glycosyltransferase involved in cell wall biosynthesis